MTVVRNRTKKPPSDLELKRRELVRRLEDGDRKIEAARREGKDTLAWENGWIRLLREYERVCDQMRANGERA